MFDSVAHSMWGECPHRARTHAHTHTHTHTPFAVFGALVVAGFGALALAALAAAPAPLCSSLCMSRQSSALRLDTSSTLLLLLLGA